MATRTIVRTPGEPPFSWGAVIAGAFTAVAVMIVLISAGTGVGLLTASSFEPTANVAQNTAIITALWLWFVHAMSFLAGGYVAGRLGNTWEKSTQAESNFRDGTHGFIAWALAAVLSTSALAGFALSGATALTSAGIHGAASGASNAATTGRMNYMIDTLLRPSGSGSGQSNAENDRAQLSRIFTYGLVKGKLSDEDKNYAAQIVARRTGVTPQEAQSRIDEAQRTAAQAAQSTARATAYTALWFLLSMLLGAIAAIFGGVWGGDDREGRETLPAGWGYLGR
ncbi:MAG TPA: hypothetical protein VHD34_05400 [Xanthobacteraceae bacterium]|nr:hypothetical protein [Xanthobacteraceae bacterium]